MSFFNFQNSKDAKVKKKDGGVKPFDTFGIGIKYNSSDPFKIEHAFNYDGLNNKFTIDKADLSPFLSGANKKITVGFSFKPDSAGTNERIFSSWDGSGRNISILRTSSNEFSVSLWTTINSIMATVTSTGGSFDSTTEYYHVAFVYDYSKETFYLSDFYVNEVLVQSTNTTANLEIAAPAIDYTLGSLATQFGDGHIKDFYILDKATSMDENIRLVNGGNVQNPYNIYGSNCKVFLNPDDTGDTAPFTMTDSISGISAVSTGMVDGDKVISLPSVIPTISNKNAGDNVYYLAGQSNAGAGAFAAPLASLQAEYVGSNPAVQVWNGLDYETLDSTTNNNEFPTEEAANTFGTEFSFTKKLADHFAKDIYLNKLAFSGTVLAKTVGENDWSVDSDTELYTYLRSQALNAGDTHLAKALVWIQGEQDAKTLADANDYETNLTNLINKFRANIGQSSLPVVIVLLNNNYPATYQATVRAAQVSISATLSNIYTVDPDSYGLEADLTHYTPTGYDDLGEAIFDVLKTL